MPDRDEFDEPHVRLAWARARAGYSDKAEFAKIVGVNPVTYRAYESGQNGFARFAAEFGKHLGVTGDWLLQGGDLPDRPIPSKPRLPDTIDKAPDHAPTRDVSEGETVSVIVLDLSLPMGPGADIDDYIEESTMEMDIGLLRSLTRSPYHRLRILKGIGDSMEPTLKSGDLVVIDTTYNRLDFEDKIWAVRIRGRGAVKRLRSAPAGQIRILSDNPLLDNDLADEDDVAILGRVVGAIRVM